MITTIISNNCTGGAVMHHMGMEFRTPTVNLQILPEQFPKFCRNLAYYLAQDLVECYEYTPEQEQMLKKMFGGIPGMPFGLLDDVLVCFQHYDTFAEAKAKWEERTERVDYDHVGYLFHARGEEYKAEAALFVALDLPNKLCITQDFEVPGSVRMDGEGFEAVNDKLRIVQAYDYRGWVNG